MATKEKTEYTATAPAEDLDYEIKTDGPARKILDGMADHIQDTGGAVAWLSDPDPVREGADPNPHSAEAIFARFHEAQRLADPTREYRPDHATMWETHAESYDMARLMSEPLTSKLTAAGLGIWDGTRLSDRDYDEPLTDTGQAVRFAAYEAIGGLGVVIALADEKGFHDKTEEIRGLTHDAERLTWEERPALLSELVNALDPALAERLFGEDATPEDWAKGFSKEEQLIMALAAGELAANWSGTAADHGSNELSHALSTPLVAGRDSYYEAYYTEDYASGDLTLTSQDSRGWPDDREGIHDAIRKAIENATEAAWRSMQGSGLSDEPQVALVALADAEAAITELTAMAEAGAVHPVDEDATVVFDLETVVARLGDLELRRNGRLLEGLERETMDLHPNDRGGHFQKRLAGLPEPDQRRIGALLEAAAPGDPAGQFEAARDIVAAAWDATTGRELAQERREREAEERTRHSADTGEDFVSPDYSWEDHGLMLYDMVKETVTLATDPYDRATHFMSALTDLSWDEWRTMTGYLHTVSAGDDPAALFAGAQELSAGWRREHLQDVAGLDAWPPDTEFDAAAYFGLRDNGPMLSDMVQQSLEANPGRPESHFIDLMEGISEDDWFRLDGVLQDVAKSGIAANEFAAVEAAGPVHTTSGSNEALFLAAEILAERWRQHVERTAPED